MSVDKLQTFNPPGHIPPAPYSHIAVVPLLSNTKLIAFAGQIGRDASTGEIPDTLGGQVKLALKNLDSCLEAAGARRIDIFQVRQYIVNLHPVDPIRVALYTEWMQGHVPPSTVVGVQSLALEGLLYEIEVMATIKSKE